MTNPAAFGERARALSTAGDFPAAEATLMAGLQAFPGHPILGYALGVLLLARGAYAEGWPYYENRRFMPKGPGQPKLSFPEWRGEAIRALVVLPEQGLGDQIMYARYLPVLAAQGITVTVVCEASLAGLFQALGVQVLVIQGQVSLPAADAWCFIGSLPRLTGAQPGQPYLPQGPGGRGVGLMLQGGPNAAERNLPPELVARLAPLGVSLHPDDSGARTFAETANIVAGLEVVVSVDTSVVHLAGAMGKPVWVILPTPCDWRWGRTGETSLWYPTARLFRQPAPGDWAGAVDALLQAGADLGVFPA